MGRFFQLISKVSLQLILTYYYNLNLTLIFQHTTYITVPYSLKNATVPKKQTPAKICKQS